MSAPKRPSNLRRGQPVIALGLLLTAWVGARAVLFEHPVPVDAQVQIATNEPQQRQLAKAVRGTVNTPANAPGQRAVRLAPAVSVPNQPALRAPPPAPPPAPPMFDSAAAPPRFDALADGRPDPQLNKLQAAAGHQLLWIAAVGQTPDAPPPAPTPGAE